MKILCSVFFAFVLASCVTTATAVDYKIDTTFNAGFLSNDQVHDLFVLPDGKLLVAGSACSGSTCTLFLRRLHADGTIDASFTSPVSPRTGGLVRSIIPQANGQLLITGDFNVGTTRSSYVRIDANGAVDATLPPAYINETELEPTPDGKYLVCGERTFNSQYYDIAYRLNSDGTFDPSFRITFIQGSCNGLKPLAGGKILIAVYNGEQSGIKPLYRLNSDGSQDTSFDAALDVSSYAHGLTVLPDGKLMVRTQTQGQNNKAVRRLHPDGGADMVTTRCSGTFFLPLSSGEILTTQCSRIPAWYLYPLEFAILKQDGTVDLKVDNINFDNNVTGFREAANNKYYAFGSFRAINKDYTTPYKKLVRLEPNFAPPKAKYDFDGDGKSDFVVYRPSDGYWYLNQSTAGISYFQWGVPGDKPAAAHFDSDGKTDIAVIRPGVLHARSSLYGHRYMNMASEAGGVPFPGNYDDEQTGVDDSMIRGPRQGGVGKFVWEGSNSWVWYFSPQIWGEWSGELMSDKGIGADLNGDSRTDNGYFRDGLWYSGDLQGQQPIAIVQWGAAGDIPVPDDYDGDRQADYAVFRPSTGDWWINRTTDGPFVLRFGATGDIPVPADYDGDGKVDIAIYRDGQWWQYLMGTGTVQVMNWGAAGDIPIPAQSQ